MSTSIPSGSIPVTGQVYRLIDSAFVGRKLSDMEISRFTAMRVRLTPTEEKPAEAKPTDARPASTPAASYATIQKDGRTIATLYPGGGLMTESDIVPPEDLAQGEAGTALADQRIRQMLALHGGTVVYTQDIPSRNAAAQAASLFTAQLAGQAPA